LKTHLSIDRFEGDKKQIAVLLTDDGDQNNFPKDLLPKGSKAGDILTLTIERDVEATGKLDQETRAVQEADPIRQNGPARRRKSARGDSAPHLAHAIITTLDPTLKAGPTARRPCARRSKIPCFLSSSSLVFSDRSWYGPASGRASPAGHLETQSFRVVT
jgi:hypothetical protein